MSAPEPFPIIPLTDDMIVQDEPMGSKDKFWCQLPDDLAGGGRWLFKQPRPEPEKRGELPMQDLKSQISNLKAR